MKKQDYIQKIKESPLSEERKNKILTLLEQYEVYDEFDIREQIKDIIQEDIDESVADLGISESDEYMKKATENLVNGLSKIEKTLEEDVNFLRVEAENLESLVNQLNKTVDDVRADAIRADIQK